MSNSPASDPFLAYAAQKGATIAPAQAASAPAPAAGGDSFLDYAKQKGATIAASPSPSAPPVPTPTAPPAPPAAPAATPPEAPSATVNRLQPKIDDGSASDAERNQWLDARSSDLHQTSLAGRIARTIHDAPYGKILPEIGGWIKNTASNAADTGKALTAPLYNPSSENLEAAGKAAISAPIGAAAEGASIGKGILGLAGNAVMAGNNLNPFAPSSDFAARVQAQHELDLADGLRKIDPASVKALAPDQAAASTGGAAVDAAAALAGGPEMKAAKAIVPEQVSLVGSEAVKAAKQAAGYDKMIAAAQKAADAAPAGPYQAAGRYFVEALKQAGTAGTQIPLVGGVLKAGATAAGALVPAAKAIGTLGKIALDSPLAQRTAVGAAAGGALSAAGASPGESAPALAQGAAGGAMVGAVRDPAILGRVNGVKAPPSLALKPNPEQPPFIPEPAPQSAPLAMGRPPAPTETAGPPAPNAAGVDEANAARPASAPLAMAATPPSTQPVSRLAGGIEAVGGLTDASRQGNAVLRAKAIGGEKPSAAIIQSQQELSDKPLATVGPVPKGVGEPAAVKASQDLGKAMLKQPEFDAFVNNLFGGNRGGSGTPTTQIRIHDMPDGSTFTSAGVKAQVVRPPGTEGFTIIRTDNPNWGDIVIHKQIEGKYAIPTDTGPQEIARIDKDNPTPLSIGGEPHQVLASRGKTDPVTLADAAGNKKVLASRTLLNADAPSVPADKSPVPMTPIAGSSNLESYGYDARTQTMRVKTKGTNDIYVHPNVPIEVARAMDEAASKGTFYNKLQRQYPPE